MAADFEELPIPSSTIPELIELSSSEVADNDMLLVHDASTASEKRFSFLSIKNYLVSFFNSIFIRKIENVAALATFTPIAGQVYYLKEYHAGTGCGGSEIVGRSGSITPNNVTTFACTAGMYVERINTDLTLFKAGGHPSRTAAQNLSALKLLIAACPVNGIATVDEADADYIIDCTAGLSQAANINKKMTLVVNGVLKSNFGAMQANPPYIFRVTSDDVVIKGRGAISGDGTVDDTNAGDETTFPGLIHVLNVDNFELSISTIDTPPKVGLLLYNCTNATVSTPNWLGGVVTYTIGNTAYFGIRSTGGKGHRIFKNNFTRNSLNGRFISGMFSGGLAGKTNYMQVYGNTADVHEKLCYLFTDWSKVYDNTVNDALITDAIRIEGSYNNINHNKGDNVLGAISVYDGFENIIESNDFTRIQQIGLYISALPGSGYVGGFDGTIARLNKFYADPTSTTLSSGIDFVVDGKSSKDIDLSENTVVGFGKLFDEGNIRLRAVSPYSVTSSRVDRNYVSGGLRAGAIIDRCVNTSMSYNKGRAITEYHLVELNGAYNTIKDNEVKTVGNIGINGLSANSYCSGNKYGDVSLIGSSTLSAVITTTVTHGGVAPNARVFLQTGNNAAGVMIVSKGWPTTAISGSDFTIVMANGTAAAGNELFFWKIEQ